MAKEIGKQITLKLMVDEKNNKVVFAESNKDFVDILFSFLTMPMGTIVRLLSQKLQPATSTIGSFTSLYQGMVDFESEYLWTENCKKMLLHPQNSVGSLVQKLELNIDDTEPTKYFKRSYCLKNHASTVKGVTCPCGWPLDQEFSAVHQFGDELGKVFINSNSLFAICDDLQVWPASCFSNDTIFNTLGISDTKVLHLKTVTVGLEEVYRLLELSLRSKSPLTDMFLRDQGFSSTSTSFGLLHFKKNEEEDTSCNCKQMTVKLIVRKADNKVLFAEAMENFIDFLFSLLTFPLGSVVELLGGNSSLGCVDNLYKSAGDLDLSSFIGSNHRKAMLISPKLPPKYLCKNQLLEVKEVDVTPLNLLDPKSPISNSASDEGYVKGPAIFMVTDNLVVTPLSPISKFLLLNSLNLDISSLEEQVISVGKKEALSLLKASLISNSALTIGLNSIFKEPKQEYVWKFSQAN